MSNYPVAFVVADKPSAFAELVPGAAQIADSVTAIYVGDPKDASNVFGLGAKKLLYIPKGPGQIFENYAATISDAIAKAPASITLLPADKRGKAMAAKLGSALKAPVVNDVNSFGPDGTLGHMVYGGLAQGTEKPEVSRVVVTVAPGTFETKNAEPGTGDTEELTFIPPAKPLTLKEVKPRAASSVNIGKAKRLVAVGRGFAKKEDIALAKAVADLIGAEIACSRPIAEGEHWMERERYVGVSGVTVKPDIYLTVGISGQIQHMVGARDSRYILAINKDKNAPIFRFADYGIIGDLYKILPSIKKALG